ncbi:hypothetical protein CEXT_46681 [Caerostris extrusa]|uniref:Uncharacterized protein n=1 Tax=Caerostris extrusa TaxID=172846 RepID=A0AAV4XKU8_CAEEX|nr:hypothetical protein CEXT_46681 [Caerostris extrusa]
MVSGKLKRSKTVKKYPVWLQDGIEVNVSRWCDIRSLLHKRPDGKPHAVEQAEHVLLDLVLLATGVGVGPFVGAESTHQEVADANESVGRHHKKPYLPRERGQKRKQRLYFLGRLSEQDADARLHKGKGEIHALQSVRGDGQVSNGQIRFL